MKTYEIVLGRSAGDIVFGMPRSEARKLLGEYCEYKNTQVEMNSFDQFAFCILGYDKDDRVDFASFNLFENIELKLENKIISNMTALQLLAYISKLDKTVEIEAGGAGFQSNAMGIAAFYEESPATDDSFQKEISYDRMESIAVAVPGYWDEWEKLSKTK